MCFPAFDILNLAIVVVTVVVLALRFLKNVLVFT